jgi:hypothetical protein
VKEKKKFLQNESKPVFDRPTSEVELSRSILKRLCPSHQTQSPIGGSIENNLNNCCDSKQKL